MMLYLVLEYILATDLKQHFEIIMTFNEKSSEMELLNESDRLLMAKMIIKMADINSPTKPYGLHRQWTERICQEFYEQGDEERKRGMPITPYMDRNDAQVAKLQDSFIAHVVSPLALAMNEAGLLPVLPGLVEPEMMINLKHNHQKWLHEIDSSNADSVPPLGNGVIEEESSTSESPDNRKCSPSLDSEVEVRLTKLCLTNPLYGLFLTY
ncbi:3'5'-cyclic nucleotide phosphodiesterase [Oesophagostomum dentatum]|uniref:3'5'-cyclic nucleotide phosphodiesterase n=1 Tax=Oesophagostomum dentatum TaxID=61180 RepID=A0A0B1T209_OESDE|nr:3'5'-cyclic nucleotide phosphodiesterase [Oesophagostomum dentatum]